MAYVKLLIAVKFLFNRHKEQCSSIYLRPFLYLSFYNTIDNQLYKQFYVQSVSSSFL